MLFGCQSPGTSIWINKQVFLIVVIFPVARKQLLNTQKQTHFKCYTNHIPTPTYPVTTDKTLPNTTTWESAVHSNVTRLSSQNGFGDIWMWWSTFKQDFWLTKLIRGPPEFPNCKTNQSQVTSRSIAFLSHTKSSPWPYFLLIHLTRFVPTI